MTNLKAEFEAVFGTEDEPVETVDVVVSEDDPLARFQRPVPSWFFNEEHPCLIMAREVGRQETLEFFYGTHTWQQAKKMCQPCPDKAECQQYAFTYNEEGVWGETTYPERQRTNNKENI